MRFNGGKPFFNKNQETALRLSVLIFQWRSSLKMLLFCSCLKSAVFDFLFKYPISKIIFIQLSASVGVSHYCNCCGIGEEKSLLYLFVFIKFLSIFWMFIALELWQTITRNWLGLIWIIAMLSMLFIRLYDDGYFADILYIKYALANSVSIRF